MHPSLISGLPRHYFAYGSNMCRRQMAERCPQSTAIGQITLPGWRFMINRCGFATIVPDDNARVRGLLWTLSPQDEKNLDGFEAVDEGEYRKEIMTLGGYRDVLVYIASDAREGRPQPGYLERIVAAATAEGLPGDYISRLASWFDRRLADG